ncbi:YciI family protein [Cellulomonas shaoxiangyii]|uniref:YCII-related domain-containing protein n=1 Tax=Cellulomonas shaoxiangyii TaxID=2566013 RepID=A0A4P7SKU2_9CELL|nr:YciI family protein [Cellulomonas shaoxiangyii]QCB94832.1 hypothetical protein E5225_15940 [Cellulomonas shaoxiangyii]TGY86562.1 hypothetical protein E5226_01965 [Cellulomonas shaoxiangyii]
MADARTYLVMLWGDEAPWVAATPEQRAAAFADHGRFSDACAAGGHEILGGEELDTARTSTLVRPGGDGTEVVDGPYTETVEQLGGFYLVRTADLAGLQALVPIIMDGGTVEIRPVVPYVEEGS